MSSFERKILILRKYSFSAPNSWKWQAVRPFSQHSNVTRVLWELKLDIQLGALIPMICFHGDLLDPEKAAWSCSWNFASIFFWCGFLWLVGQWFKFVHDVFKGCWLSCDIQGSLRKATHSLVIWIYIYIHINRSCETEAKKPSASSYQLSHLFCQIILLNQV